MKETTNSIFNPNDYQGRRQDQVEANHKAVVWVTVIFGVSILTGLILECISKIIGI